MNIYFHGIWYELCIYLNYYKNAKWYTFIYFELEIITTTYPLSDSEVLTYLSYYNLYETKNHRASSKGVHCLGKSTQHFDWNRPGSFSITKKSRVITLTNTNLVHWEARVLFTIKYFVKTFSCFSKVNSLMCSFPP